VQLVEGKFCKQIAERYNDHQPPDRTPKEYEPGRPPAQFALNERLPA
jgi:hypothetical protein